MRYWTWQIPQAYRETITELGLEGHPLYDDFRKLQYTESGTLLCNTPFRFMPIYGGIPLLY